jgi:flagellar basal-body rod protein FlgB
LFPSLAENFKGIEMNLLNSALGVHEQALKVKSQRLEVLSQNIANADTPNYKARDLDFKALLNHTRNPDMQLQATHAGHMAHGEPSGTQGLKYRNPFNTAFDGNTVEMSVEQANYGQAAAQYQATLSFLENRVSGLRRALRGE